MKKILAVWTIVAFSLTACADRQHVITFSELPVPAQTFIQKHFHPSDVTYIEYERDGFEAEFNVYLKNGTELDFAEQGEFEAIDCKVSPVPEGIVPKLITDFVLSHYSNHFIVEYAIDAPQQKIELSNGLELIFDLRGNFIRIDD